MEGYLVHEEEPPDVSIAPAPAERELAVDSDGWVFDILTGEVIKYRDVDERFSVDTDARADWVLEIRSEVEGRIAGLRARREALLQQLAALEGELVKRLSWWEWRFRPALVEYARSKLSGKSRTARFAWGRVAFRTSPGTNEIVDEEAAVAWMRVWAPEKVKVTTKESVGVRDVLQVRDSVAAELGEDPEHLPWLKSSGPEETVQVDTGLFTETKHPRQKGIGS